MNTTGEKGGNLINLSEEIDFLKERLYVELLTSNENNKNAIEKFVANDNGKPLEEFLKNKAWKQDLNNEIRVYLVKDRVTGEILFYFALKTGLLFESIKTKFGKLTEVEQEIVNTYIDIYLDPNAKDDPEVVFDWYEGIQINTAKVLDSIELQLDAKNEIKIDSESAEDSINVMQVAETFPGLVITHFCKNINTSFSKEFSFPLGFYVFWEIIVKVILKISKLVGFQYVYIFAADHSKQTYIQPMNFFETDDFETEATLKLVDYYKNEFKFEELEAMTVLKPRYDFECHSLVQNVNDLLENRRIAWEQISKQ